MLAKPRISFPDSAPEVEKRTQKARICVRNARKTAKRARKRMICVRNAWKTAKRPQKRRIRGETQEKTANRRKNRKPPESGKLDGGTLGKSINDIDPADIVWDIEWRNFRQEATKNLTIPEKSLSLAQGKGGERLEP